MRFTRHPQARQSESAFTMVEIAISLAIIGFALVAIIGVLPLGLDVQKENRQETIINQDAGYFMDGIRNGARGLDDLTNYVLEIRRYVQAYDASTNQQGATISNYYAFGFSAQNGTLMSPPCALTNGLRIIGLLATPKYTDPNPPFHMAVDAPFNSNYVVAYVRALSGSAVEKAPQTDSAIRDLAFSYRVVPEVVSVPAYDTFSPYAKNLQTNLNELRLLFRWPLLPNNRTGNGRQNYRSLVAGSYFPTNQPGLPGPERTLYFFDPTTFVSAP